MKNIFLLLIAFGAISAHAQDKTRQYEAEIRKAEKDFNDLAQSKSISEAFYAFADESAVIKRENDTLIKGRENIKKYGNNTELEPTF